MILFHGLFNSKANKPFEWPQDLCPNLLFRTLALYFFYFNFFLPTSTLILRLRNLQRDQKSFPLLHKWLQLLNLLLQLKSWHLKMFLRDWLSLIPYVKNVILEYSTRSVDKKNQYSTSPCFAFSKWKTSQDKQDILQDINFNHICLRSFYITSLEIYKRCHKNQMLSRNGHTISIKSFQNIQRWSFNIECLATVTAKK